MNKSSIKVQLRNIQSFIQLLSATLSLSWTGTTAALSSSL